MPRTRLPEVLRRIAELGDRYGLRIGNVFHAGDGNLHPLVLYDAAPARRPRAKEARRGILEICMDVGGSLTGEHGIGVDKACSMPSMFGERDLADIRAAAARLRPGRAREPGQGAADAAALRRGAGAVPCPPAREAGACRASLSHRRGGRASCATRTRPVAPCGSATTSPSPGSTACSSTRRATSPARSRPASGSRRCTAALGAAGQRLALDPPGDPTIGACLAAALCGPRRHRYGAPRDLVLGVTLVLADGTIASAGGKVVKNVAGYDLGKLVCGSRGTLGLIARVSLRLHPLPRRRATLLVETDDPAERRRAPAALAARAERARRPAPGRRGRALRGRRDGRRGAAARRRARSSAAREAGRRGLGREPRAAGGRAGRRPLRAGRARATALRGSTRPSCGRRAGVAYVAARRAATESRRAAARRARTERDPRRRFDPHRAILRRRDPRAHRRLRALRLLPADLPHLRAVERGDGLAARPHPADGGAARRDDRAEPHRRRALRPLPRLHGVRHAPAPPA